MSPRARVWIGSLLIAYAIYRATAALLSHFPVGLVPAAIAAALGVALLRSARAGALARTAWEAKPASVVERARYLAPVVLTLVLFVLVVAGIASTYIGHSRSPYDTCYGANGRAISCTLLHARR